MLGPIDIRYPFRAVRRSLVAGEVADLFGLTGEESPCVVAEDLVLDVRPGDVVLFVGPSGSGKSSLLREVGKRLKAVDAAAVELPGVPLVEALPGPVEGRLGLLSACGLGEARLMLRTPSELSDGQRYRFRIALAFAHCGMRNSDCGMKCKARITNPHSEIRNPQFVVLDEFTAVLDRRLAKVVAFNLRKLASRTGVGVLAATTHEDVLVDLNPDVVVRCVEGGPVGVERRRVRVRPISFAKELRVCEGTAADWHSFARWHYRGHSVAFVRKVVSLRHGREPVGVCVFAAPAAALKLRTEYFGLRGVGTPVALAALNEQLWCLARVVLQPTYRGAGIAAEFIRQACRMCPVPWIETLAAMGRVNPVFEKAGFERVGEIEPSARGRNGAYSRGPSGVKGRFARPVYYVLRNILAGGGRRRKIARPSYLSSDPGDM